MVQITKTSYREGSAAQLLAYIGRDNTPIKDRTGRELSIGEQAHFISQSESYEFEREIIVSPDHPEELSDREIELRTRQTMREFTQDRPTARYVYAVHRDTENTHAHVALTGTREDLYMDREDVNQVRECAAERFRDAEREAARETERDEQETVLTADRPQATVANETAPER